MAVGVPINCDNALARFNSLIRILKKDSSTLKRYDEIVKEQVALDIVEQVSEIKAADEAHYLPHMAVFREKTETKKVKIVCGVSCKDKKFGTSLNDCLHAQHLHLKYLIFCCVSVNIRPLLL